MCSEQYVQEPLLSYVSNRDLSSDTERVGDGGIH